jgi:ATP-dependent DNA helicase 2 subunit 1
VGREKQRVRKEGLFLLVTEIEVVESMDDIEDDPDYDIFRDDEDDPDAQHTGENDFTKEYVVYLVDASPKMLNTICHPTEEEDAESHFQIALTCISHSLKAQIINKSYDQVAICFFNTVTNFNSLI